MTVPSPSGFWGLVVEPGKNYSQEVPNTFKLTMASLGSGSETKPGRTTLIMQIDEKENYSLCSLSLGKTEQQPLDLVFAQGETISFQVEGESSIHLTGYYLDDAADDFIDDDEVDSEDGDEVYSDEAEEDSQIEYDSEFDSEEYDEECSDDECAKKSEKPRIRRIETDESDLEDDDEEVDSEEDEEEELDSEEDFSEEEEDSEEEVKSEKRSVKFDLPEAKKVKESPKAAQPQQATKQAQSQQAAKQAQPQQPAKQVQPQQPVKANELQKAAPLKKTLPSGLQIEDLKLGNGAKAANGKTVLIHYKGTLTNGKVFDSSFGKSPLKFKVRAGDVIKGMDMGVVGMAVGGSRKLVIPAALAYGHKALPGIPSNSTLIFEIRLEKVF